MKTILFVQGLGMTKHEYKNSFDEIADRLQRVGYNTIQIDFPIFDHGETRELSLSSRAKLVEDVAKRYKPEGILAQSYGATTILVAHLPTVKTQLLVSAALSPLQSIKRVYEEVGMKVNFDGETKMPRSSGEDTIVGKEFWEDIRAFDDRQAAQRITIPTCILHGTNDTKIPVSTVKKFYDAIPVQIKQLKEFEGGDHGIVDIPREMREEFLKVVVVWFQRTL